VAPALAALRVPPLLLQPLVENAVKHGISRQRDGGEVRVSARVQRAGPVGPELVLTVADTGTGARPDELQRGRAMGVGLRNVERRLACQYGDTAGLTIQTAPNLGTTVEIRLPLRSRTAVEAGGQLQGTAR
jgi:sensor histidine kinase YesM